MNQDFEQRVNQIILEQNVLPSEAVEIAQKQLADEEIKKKESGDKSTDSDSSDGTFKYIDKPQLPLTQWQKEQLEANPQWEEDILNTRFTAKDQEEVNALNAEYQLDVERYNQERQRELGKLVNNLSFVSDEEASASLVGNFMRQTGIEIDEELSSLIYREAENQKNEREVFRKDESKAMALAEEQQDFVHLQSFYESHDVPEEEIKKIETQFNTGLLIQDAYEFSRNPEEFSETLNSLFLDIESQATTKNQKSEIQKRKLNIISDYTESYNERGDALMVDSRNGVREMSRQLSDIRKEINKIIREEGEDAIKMWEQGGVEYLQEPGQLKKLERMDYMKVQADQLSNSIKTSRSANNTLKDIFKKYPEAEAVLPLIASAHRSMIGVMEPDIRKEYYDHKITRDEALRQSFILSNARAEAEERAGMYGNLAIDDTVILGAAEVYTTTTESEDTTGRVAYTDAFDGEGTYEHNLSSRFVDEQNRALTEYYKDLLPEIVKNMKEEDKEDFEKAVVNFTGMPLDFSGDDWVGRGWHLNGLKFFGGMVDLGGVLFQQAPAQLGRWLDYEIAMSKAESDEERLAIEKRDLERADVIEYQGNWRGMEWADSFGAMANEGKGAWDSFSEGNWSSGFKKLGNMVFEMAPATVAAMGASVLSGGSAAPGFLLFYTNSMVSTYNYARDLDWYKDKSPLWRGLFLNGTALLESITESIGTKAQLRILGPGKARGLGQTRVSYMGQKIGNQFVETGIETSSELTNTLASGFLEESMGGEGTTTGEVFETILGAGALSTTTASVGAAKRQASAILSNNSIETIGLADYYRREIDLLINETEPNSQARNLRLSSIFEEMNSLAALNADTYELHEYIAGVDEASSQKLVENSVKTFSAIKALEDQNLSRKDRETLTLQVENLAKERLDIEQKHLRSFSLATAQLESGRNIENLNERARIFEAQSESLRKAGKEAQADSMLGRAKRVRDRVETLELVTEVENALTANEVISSENKDPKQIADMLEGQITVLVDEQLAEQLKKNGFVEVQYEGSADAKLMVKSQSKETVGSSEMTLEQAQKDAYLMAQEEKGAMDDRELAGMIATKLRNGDQLTKVEQRLMDSRGETFAARVEEVKSRTKEDLTQPSKDEPVVLSEESQSVLDKLSNKFKEDLKLTIDVISEKEAYRRDYESATDKESVLAEYLNGGYIGGSHNYNERTNTSTITITSAAQIKDVVEEFSHAVVAQKFNKETSKEKKFQKAVRDIVLSDPYLRQAIAEKELDYVSRGDTRNLQEELFIEALSIIATRKGRESVLDKTRRMLTELFSTFIPGFKESGADPLNVLSRLSSTLGADYLDIEGAVGQALSYPLDQEDGVMDIENATTERDAQRVMNSRRGPTFLNDKTVTFDTLRVNKYSGHATPTGRQQKTFKDYYHFVNWYRKMTGNCAFTRIGSMSYVDQDGNTRKLYPPKPLINEETGNPIYMEPAMKSYDQRMISEYTRIAEEKEELRRMSIRASQTISGIVDQIHDQVAESMKRTGWRDFPMGNTRDIIQDLMSDYKEGGTLNKENLDNRGKPIRENIEGSPQYFEDLYIRVNEYMEANHPDGTPVLYSRRGVRKILDGRSDMSSSQKRKSLEYVFEKAKPYLSNMKDGDSIAKEIERYMENAGDDKIGSGFPSFLSRPLLNAFMIARAEYQAINPNDYTQNQEDTDMMAELVMRELIDIDKELLGLPRNFFKNFYKEVSSHTVNGQTVDGVGIEIGAMSPDPVTGALSVNPKKIELSRKHKDLLIAIVGVMSNGNIALINIEEAAKFYAVVLEDVLTHKGDGPIPFTRTKARIEEINKYQSRRGSKLGRGDVIATGLERILGFTSYKKTSTPYDFNGKKAGSVHYAFKRQFLTDKPRAKKGENTYEIQGQTDFGNWKKIGAFIANLYQRNDLLTQDRHFVNYIDSRFRPGISKGFDIEELFSIIEKQYGVDKLNELKREWAIKPDNLNKENQPIYYSRLKARKWVNEHKGKKDRRGTCYGSKAAIALRQFFDSDIRDKGGAEGQEFKDNIRLMELVVEKMRRIKGYSSVTVDQAMQMAFAAEHILPSAIGVQGRKYDDFAKETWEEAKRNILEDGLIKAQGLSISDQLSQFTLDSVIENLAAKNNLTDEQKLGIYIDKAETMEAIENARNAGDVTHYSRRGVVSLTGHPQSRAYDVSQIFKGRQASMMSDVRFSSTGFNLNKLLEGRASEVNFKAKISNVGKADDMEAVVDGVIFMRHPLYSESFVDPYGNVLKYAEKAVMSGDMLVASGNVRFDKAPPRTPSEQINVSAPEHFVAFQNFVSILKQRNQSLQGTNTDMFEAAYKSLSAKDRARFANLTVDEHGNVIKGRRLRGTSKRLASSSEFGRFKNEIINNPNNYIDRQKIANEKKALEEMSPQELVSLMRGDALNNLATRNDDVGVLAGIELINRLQEEGNDIGIVSVLDQLAAVGTTAGRVLRHMAELRTSSPQGMASVIIKKAEQQGKILSESQKKEILDATKEYMRAYKMAENFMERGIAGEDVENLFKRAQDDLDSAQRVLDTLANKYIEKSWAEIGQQLVQGNLLTMMSQARNVVYNLANIIPKTIVDITSMPASKAFELFGLHKEQRKLSLASYLYAMRKFGAGTVEAIEQVITGREKDMSEWRMSRGFMPIRSLMHAMSTDLPEGQTMRSEFNQRAKLLVQGTFGIPAEAMFRLLSLGDVPFRRFAEGLELYNIGRGKGLEGDALAQFLKFPDKDSADAAATEGRKLTFQEPMGLARGSMWIIDNISRGMGQAFKNVKGFNGEGFFKFLIRLNVPYVSTIANFTEETLTYASPVFGGGKMAIQMGNGEYTEASRTLSKIMVGQTVSTTALYLISKGLLSGSVDWEDDEKTNLMYDAFPPNSINVSGLRRLLNGEDPSPMAGDEFRSYQTLGVFGTIMGAYAHSTTPEAAKEMAEQPFTGNNAIKKIFGFDNVSVIAYMMDQSFLQGLNGITSVIASTKDPDDFEKAFFKYIETISKAFSSMFLPNALSGYDQATREFLPDKRDVDFTDRIKNHVRERTFNTGGLPVKVNWKGERIEQAPVGGNQFAYYMFDATKKREAPQDEVSIEILNLYLNTGVLTKAVGTPYYASSVYRKLDTPSVSRGKAKKAYENLGITYQFLENPQEEFFVRLTAEEINNALEMSNTLRYNDIKSFMQTDDYKGMTDNEKIEALDEINDRYKSLLSFNPDDSFMEHSKYILSIMERRYLEQYGQN